MQCLNLDYKEMGIIKRFKERGYLERDTIIDGQKNHVMILGFAFILLLPFLSGLFSGTNEVHFVMSGESIVIRSFMFNVFVIIGDMLSFALAAYVIKNNILLTKIFASIAFTKLLVLFDYIAFQNKFESTLICILVFNILFIYSYNVLKGDE